MICRRYQVHGRVQGVFFRASTREQAMQIGVRGWVRNRPDGTVECIACGTEQQLATLEAWLRQGPPMAEVSQLEINAHEQIPENTAFIIC